MTTTPTPYDYADYADYDDEDEALTRPIHDLRSPWRPRSDEEITGSVQVHRAFTAELTPEPLPAVDLVPISDPPPPEAAWPAPPPAVEYAPPAYPPAAMAAFSPTPPPHALLQSSTPLPRARFDSEVSTWQRTVPALRRRVQAPVAPAPWDPTEPRQRAPLIPSVPPPAVMDARVRPPSAAPFVALAAAVGLVALVVLSIVGFGARSRAAAAASRLRDVSASAPDGTPVTDARVLVDGATICERLPCSLELAEGTHWMTISAAGFEAPPSRAVGASGDEPNGVHFRLTREARPAETADAPIQTPALLPVAAPATAPAAALRPASPRRAPIVARSARGSGHLNVNSIPPANVVVDGRPVGSTPVMGLTLAPGAHTVVLVTSDGRRAVRGATVKAGSTAVVSTRL
jgi:eukaryotic-like serine/threonine-protein kinase